MGRRSRDDMEATELGVLNGEGSGGRAAAIDQDIVALGAARLGKGQFEGLVESLADSSDADALGVSKSPVSLTSTMERQIND